MYSHSFSPRYAMGISLSGRGSSTRYYQNNGNGKAFQIWRINTTHEFQVKKSKLKVQSLEASLGVDNIFNYVDRTMRPYHLGNNTSGTTVYSTVSIKFNYGKKVKQYHLSNKQQNDNETD